jgi:hypothetical protein
LLPSKATTRLHTYYTGSAGWQPVVAGHSGSLIRRSSIDASSTSSCSARGEKCRCPPTFRSTGFDRDTFAPHTCPFNQDVRRALGERVRRVAVRLGPLGANGFARACERCVGPSQPDEHRPMKSSPPVTSFR